MNTINTCSCQNKRTLRNSSTNRMNRMMIKWTWKKEGKLKERKKSAIIKTNQANKSSSSLSLLFVFTKLRIWEFLSFFLSFFSFRSQKQSEKINLLLSFFIRVTQRFTIIFVCLRFFMFSWNLNDFGTKKRLLFFETKW